MEYYSEHELGGQEYIERNILDLLYSMKRNQKNHALLTEYFLHEFSRDPESITSIMRLIKTHLEDSENVHREKLARRYLNMFSFLCERFGLYQVKLELDDLCFKITQPVEYSKLDKEFSDYKKSSASIIKSIKAILEDRLSDSSFIFSLEGRYKNLYSIYQKCEKKELKNALGLGDIFAFRIVINDEPQTCFEALNILHDSFIPLPNRYKDYISIPKINGYQSLHTGIIGIFEDLDIPIEIQIRTKIMNEVAQSGIAAHFLYGQSKSSKLISEKEQKLIDHLEKVADTIPENPYIYCITPLGDILRVKRGSTAIDFASKIHTSLAKKAIGVKINMEDSPMTSIVKNFDHIEIITK